jgi:hypothetical protein
LLTLISAPFEKTCQADSKWYNAVSRIYGYRISMSRDF